MPIDTPRFQFSPAVASGVQRRVRLVGQQTEAIQRNAPLHLTFMMNDVSVRNGAMLALPRVDVRSLLAIALVAAIGSNCNMT